MQLYEITEARFEPSLVASRFAETREKIAEICREADRPAPSLVAVTKTVPVEVINYAIENLGVTAIGENRVQELLSKYDRLASLPSGGKPSVHLIGTLQKNKVKYIIDKVDMIESVDSEPLAAEIDRQAKKIGRKIDILVEVNIGREPQKGGVLPEELFDFIRSLGKFDALNLRGLMAVAPKCDRKEDYLKYFSEIFQFFIDIPREIPHNIYSGANLPELSHFDTLSMGMSGSFEEAIKCGSTEIRLGSTLFGARPAGAVINDPHE